MDRVLPKFWVTRTLDPGDVPDRVDHVFVFGGDVSADPGESLAEGVEVTWAVDEDLAEFEAFARLADDVVYATKAGKSVLVVRRDDAVLTLAALGRVRNDSPRQAVEFLETAHGLDARPFGETLPGHLRQYIYG